MYNHKYRKASKKWGITPAMENKKFLYIQSLMQSILTHRKESSFSMKHKEPIPAEHHIHIQRTIGHKQPTTTEDIGQKKSS